MLELLSLCALKQNLKNLKILQLVLNFFVFHIFSVVSSTYLYFRVFCYIISMDLNYCSLLLALLLLQFFLFRWKTVWDCSGAIQVILDVCDVCNVFLWRYLPIWVEQDQHPSIVPHLSAERSPEGTQQAGIGDRLGLHDFLFIN